VQGSTYGILLYSCAKNQAYRQAEECCSVEKYVESLLGQLDKQRAMIREKLDKLEQKRKETILGAG
jgi:hypothetical protein